MIFVVSWAAFQARTAGANVYVVEEDDRWNLFAVMSSAEVLKCVMLKSENAERNIMFVDKHLMDKRNVIKIIGVEEGGFTLRLESDRKEAEEGSMPEPIPIDVEEE